MFFQNIPVFRSAYFPKKLFSFFSKTLDLQVRFAHPPMPHRSSSLSCSGVTHGLFGSDSALRCWNQNAHASGSLRSPYDAAPKCFFKTFRCSGRLIFRKSFSAFSPKRSTFRFASLSLRWAGEASLPPAPLSPAPEERERTGRRKAHSTGWEKKPRTPPKAALCGRAADAGTAKPGARFACAGFARAGWEAPRGSGGAAAPPVCPAAGAAGQRLTGGR